MGPYLLVSLGAVLGEGVALFAPLVIREGRPVVKDAIKAAMLTAHELQVRGLELAEAAEDLYAEAKAEADAEIAAAAASARAAASKHPTKPVRHATRKAPAKRARKAQKRAASAATTE